MPSSFLFHLTRNFFKMFCGAIIWNAPSIKYIARHQKTPCEQCSDTFKACEDTAKRARHAFWRVRRHAHYVSNLSVLTRKFECKHKPLACSDTEKNGSEENIFILTNSYFSSLQRVPKRQKQQRIVVFFVSIFCEGMFVIRGNIKVYINTYKQQCLKMRKSNCEYTRQLIFLVLLTRLQ